MSNNLQTPERVRDEIAPDNGIMTPERLELLTLYCFLNYQTFLCKATNGGQCDVPTEAQIRVGAIVATELSLPRRNRG
jgi:hypothetical protein